VLGNVLHSKEEGLFPSAQSHESLRFRKPHKLVHATSSSAMDAAMPPLSGWAVLMQPSERYQSDTPKLPGEYSAAS